MDARYDNHRDNALSLLAPLAEVYGAEADEISHAADGVRLKMAHVEALIYVGDQISRLCALVEPATAWLPRRTS